MSEAARIDPTVVKEQSSVSVPEKRVIPTKIVQLLRRVIEGPRKAKEQTTASAAPEKTLNTQLSRRVFLQKAAAASAGVAAALSFPAAAKAEQLQSAEQTPIDTPTAFPVEQYHFNKNEARALYEQVVQEYGYDRFLYAVSENYPLPEDFPENEAEIPLVAASSLGISSREGVQVAELAAGNLQAMMLAAQAEEFTPFLTSGFRDIAYQRQLYEGYIAEEIQARGCSREEAEQVVSRYSARPRTSEHHLGTAVDILAYPNQSWDEARLNYNQGFFQWLREHAHEYGFVISFPTGQSEYEAKSSAAVESAEPWHLRFVGEKVAEYFVKCNYLHPESSASVHTLLIDPYFSS